MLFKVPMTPKYLSHSAICYQIECADHDNGGQTFIKPINFL